jgi:hypothetical protein
MTVLVEEATGLTAIPTTNGANAHNAPYVKIVVGSHGQNTDVAQTLNPKWNKTFTLYVPFLLLIFFQQCGCNACRSLHSSIR